MLKVRHGLRDVRVETGFWNGGTSQIGMVSISPVAKYVGVTLASL
jgi:hypothetical protein